MSRIPLNTYLMKRQSDINRYFRPLVARDNIFPFIFIVASWVSIPDLPLTAETRDTWLLNVTCNVLTFRVVLAQGNVCRGDHLAWLTGSRQLQLRPSDLGSGWTWNCRHGTNITLRPWGSVTWENIHFNQNSVPTTTAQVQLRIL